MMRSPGLRPLISISTGAPIALVFALGVMVATNGTAAAAAPAPPTTVAAAVKKRRRSLSTGLFSIIFPLSAALKTAMF